MQPYQQASEALQEREGRPLKLAKGLASIGLGLGGVAASARVLPFLSKYVPESLAIAGLSKISPGFKKFFDKAKEEGVPFEEAKDFIGEKMASAEEEAPKEKPKETRNIIEKYSPELFSFLKERVAGGMSPIVAGFQAKGEKKFDSAIKKMEKDHAVDWSAILDTVFGESGGAQQAQAPQPQQTQPQQGQMPQAQMTGEQPIGPHMKNLMGMMDNYMASRPK